MTTYQIRPFRRVGDDQIESFSLDAMLNDSQQPVDGFAIYRDAADGTQNWVEDYCSFEEALFNFIVVHNISNLLPSLLMGDYCVRR